MMPLTLTRHDTGTCVLVGARDALEAHPLCPPSLFDGYSTVWKASRTLHHEGRKYQVLKLGARFRLWVYATEEESAAARKRRSAAADVTRTCADVQSKLARLPASSSAWRAEALETLRLLSRGVDAITRGEPIVGGGFALDQDGQNLVGVHLQAIRQAIKTGRVVFNPGTQQAQVQRIMAPLRQKNPEVQSFLQRVQGGAQ